MLNCSAVLLEKHVYVLDICTVSSELNRNNRIDELINILFCPESPVVFDKRFGCCLPRAFLHVTAAVWGGHIVRKNPSAAVSAATFGEQPAQVFSRPRRRTQSVLTQRRNF